jgi:hypothetical protein
MAEIPPKPPEITATDTAEAAPGATDYAVIVGKQAAQTESVYAGMGKAAAAVTATAPLTPAFQTVARKAPIIGAMMSAVQAAAEIKTDIKESKYAKAGVATVAGAVEVVGNIAGFGIGDSAREIVRSTAIKLGGEELAVQKSDLRTASETLGRSAAAIQNSAENEAAAARNNFKNFAAAHAPELVKTEDLLMNMGMTAFKPPKP